jgi:hypothetical protein
MGLKFMHGHSSLLFKETQKWAKGTLLHGFLICCFGNFFFSFTLKCVFLVRFGLRAGILVRSIFRFLEKYQPLCFIS